jgi:FkbM family methyltransferase
MKSKVYIEVGGNDGETLERVINGDIKYDYYYVFEPHPKFYKLICEKFISHTKVIVYNKAVSNNDGICDFFMSTSRDDGHTIMNGKITGKVDYNHPIKVECVDFGKWIKEKFFNDILDIRMDIEGGEYIVIPRMIEDGSIFLINSLSIEFHDNRFRDMEIKQKHNEILEFLKTNKIRYKVVI